jgi:hypothetical protein
MKSTTFLFTLLAAGLTITPAWAIVVAGSDPNSGQVVGSSDFFQGLSLSGVVQVGTNHGGCSGALLSDGISILTAGHCVSPGFGQPDYANPQVVFMGPTNNGPGTGGFQTIFASQVFVNPGWNGDATLGFDIAVIRLGQQGPAYATRYSLYSGLPVASPLLIAGYGYGGTGLTGYDANAYPINGTLRSGNNTYVADGSAVGWSSSLLIGQFYDANTPSTNAFGVANPYTSGTEVTLSPGDSGGPSFYNGQIIGVHDVITCASDPTNPTLCAVPPSINPNLKSYFGQLYGDTSVSANADWIAAQQLQAPEPGTIGLLFAGVAMFGTVRFRRSIMGGRNAHDHRSGNHSV